MTGFEAAVFVPMNKQVIADYPTPVPGVAELFADLPALIDQLEQDTAHA